MQRLKNGQPKVSTFTAALFGSTLLMQASCGTLIDNKSEAPTLISFSGVILDDPHESVQTGELRLALIWRPHWLGEYVPPNTPDHCFGVENDLAGLGFVAQEVEIIPTFPVQFRLDISEPPPPQALVDNGVSGGWTFGQFVLYRDGNSNGKLDAENPTQSSPDEVIGGSSDWFGHPRSAFSSYIIYYSEAELEQYYPTIKKGFTLFRDEVDAEGHGERVVVPLDTSIPIIVEPNSKFTFLNCEQVCMRDDEEFECPQSFDELPNVPDARTSCSGSTFDWMSERRGQCQHYARHCWYDLEDGSSTENWPCPESGGDPTGTLTVD